MSSKKENHLRADRNSFNNGSLFHFRVTGLGEKIAVTQNNLLLRECVIRNTDFVEGIVVYAGKKNDGVEY